MFELNVCLVGYELNAPWLTKGFGTQTVRGFVVDKGVSLEIQVHLTIQEQCNVRSMACDVSVACGQRVALRLATRFHAI